MIILYMLPTVWEPAPHLGNGRDRLFRVKSLEDTDNYTFFTRKVTMIQTEQLSPDTIMFHVEGPFHQRAAKELGLSVFCSYRLGFKTFLFNLSQVSLLDDQGSRQLAIIGQGLEEKCCTWRVIRPPSSVGHQLILRTSLQHFSQAMWN